uniref:Uncharacterized protein n=1 Tax=Ditylenchus dipsaci TaxID=166011 RepID=A0A915D396_9BILA
MLLLRHLLLKCSYGRLAAILVLLIVVPSQLFVSVLMPRWYGKPNVRVNGFVDERFKDMSNIFRENFVDGFERDGSHLSVYHKAIWWVDLWAGMADTSKAKLWTGIHRQYYFRSLSLCPLCV